MRVYFQKGDEAVLYQGDAGEVLRKLPEGFVDLIVTSPPYNVGKVYGEAVNDEKSYEEYLEFARGWLRGAYRVLKYGGRIAVNVPSCLQQSARSRYAYMAFDYVRLMREVGFVDMDWIVWVKSKDGLPVAQNTAWGSWCSPSHPYLRDACEYVIVMAKGSKKRLDKKGRNDIKSEEFMQFTTNVWMIPPARDKEHPAVFPKELPYRLMKLYTWEGDVVLDPFSGSGTTLVVGGELGRKVVGIEIEEKWCEVAVRRLKMVSRKLF
jgi:site-specific DNA-methyltransferase (adenine-specific)